MSEERVTRIFVTPLSPDAETMAKARMMEDALNTPEFRGWHGRNCPNVTGPELASHLDGPSPCLYPVERWAVLSNKWSSECEVRFGGLSCAEVYLREMDAFVAKDGCAPPPVGVDFTADPATGKFSDGATLRFVTDGVAVPSPAGLHGTVPRECHGCVERDHEIERLRRVLDLVADGMEERHEALLRGIAAMIAHGGSRADELERIGLEALRGDA